jgi:hypothetical protein
MYLTSTDFYAGNLGVMFDNLSTFAAGRENAQRILVA